MKAEQVTVRRLGVSLAVAAALLTSACAAGQHAATAYEKPTLDGANATVGQLSLRGVVVEPPSSGATSYPKGSNLPLTFVVVNNGRTPDELVSVSSPVAGNWAAYGTKDDAAIAATGSSAPTGSSGGASLPTPLSSLSSIAPGYRQSFGTPEAKGALLLLGSTKALYPGNNISVTMTFKNAGAVTFEVPIGLSSSPNTSVLPAPISTGIEG